MKALDYETAMLLLEKFDAISVVNSKGEYIYANQNWLNTFHVTLNELTGLHPWDILPDTRIREVLKNHKPIIAHALKSNNSDSPYMKGFVSYYPIEKCGTFFGVLIWVFYTWMDTTLKFSRTVAELSQELERTKAQLHAMSTARYSIGNIVGESPAIVRLREEIIQAARTTSTVLIEGETGVGKELVAHSIHDLSARHRTRFARVNCSAIPEELMESEFFGYEEGTFTGARRGGKAGKFELADRGSLFLDEINQPPITIQPKFLRVLQEQEIERVGGRDPVKIDVRIIAATNIPLEHLVAEGKFRSDLYYRLNVIRIRVPPLRERKSDIPMLVRSLVAKLNQQLGLDINHIDEGIYAMLADYDWPGNIRELQNVLENAMNHTSDDTLECQHFDFSLLSGRGIERPQMGTERELPGQLGYSGGGSLQTMKRDMEYAALREAMIQCRGNKTEAAKLLGISRNALYKKLKKFCDQ